MPVGMQQTRRLAVEHWAWFAVRGHAPTSPTVPLRVWLEVCDQRVSRPAMRRPAFIVRRSHCRWRGNAQQMIYMFGNTLQKLRDGYIIIEYRI